MEMEPRTSRGLGLGPYSDPDWKEDGVVFMDILPDPVSEVYCPFNPRHNISLVDGGRDAHLAKCRAEFIRAYQAKNAPNTPLEKKVCRYNHAHIVITEEFNFHEQYCCPNKKDYDMLPIDLGDKLKLDAKIHRKAEKMGKRHEEVKPTSGETTKKEHVKKVTKKPKISSYERYVLMRKVWERIKAGKSELLENNMKPAAAAAENDPNGHVPKQNQVVPFLVRSKEMAEGIPEESVWVPKPEDGRGDEASIKPKSKWVRHYEAALHAMVKEAEEFFNNKE